MKLKTKHKIGLILLLLLSTIYNLLIFHVDKNIDERVDKTLYDSCHKIWSARGIYRKHSEQNSLLSFKRAFDSGYLGAEVDFYYDTDSNRFIVSHDKPKKNPDGSLIYTLKDNEILTLEKLFSERGEGHYFWLDYKNLDRLSDDETQKAILRLEAISKIHNIKSRLYVEGSAPWVLSEYTGAGFYTILAVQPFRESSIFASFSANIFKIAFYYSNVSVLGIPYREIDDPKFGKTVQKVLRDIPVFIFHGPTEPELLKELSGKSNVKMILSGRDVSLNRADIVAKSGCNLPN